MLPEEFLEILNDDEVVKRLHSIFETLISLMIKVVKLFEIRIDKLSANIKMLQKEFNYKNSVIEELRADKNDLYLNMKSIEINIERAEQCSRRDNLIISGVLASAAETAAFGTRLDATILVSTVFAVMDVCSDLLGVPIKSEDISAAHRLHSYSNSN